MAKKKSFGQIYQFFLRRTEGEEREAFYMGQLDPTESGSSPVKEGL